MSSGIRNSLGEGDDVELIVHGEEGWEVGKGEEEPLVEAGDDVRVLRRAVPGWGHEVCNFSRPPPPEVEGVGQRLSHCMGRPAVVLHVLFQVRERTPAWIGRQRLG